MSTEQEKMKVQSVQWLFTINHNDPTLELNWENILTTREGIKYACAGKEIGPENGIHHFQGFVVFVTKKRIPEARKFFIDKTVHIGDWNSRPSFSQILSADYCIKDGQFIEIGTRPRKSTGDDEKGRWDGIRDLCKRQKVMEAIELHPHLISHMGSLERYAAKFSRPFSMEKLDNYWIWGDTGKGKTFWVRNREGDKLYVAEGLDKFDFGTYNTDVHKAVLIDDVTADDLRGQVKKLKNISDHYSFNPQTKGGYIGHIRPERIYVTSFSDPKDYLPSVEYVQIKRRFKIMNVESIEFKILNQQQ